MKYRFGSLMLAAALAGGCIDNDPVSPDFEKGLFSLLGGLEVGETLTFTGDQAEQFILDGGADGAQYMFIPFLAAEEGALQLRIEVSGNDLIDVLRPSGVQSLAPAAEPVLDPRSTALHDDLRARERSTMAGRVRSTVRVQRRATMDGTPVNLQVTATPQIGEILPLRVINLSPSNPDICANPLQRSGRVAAITENAILVEDVANPVALTAIVIDRIAAEYEELVHPVAVENFGEPTDIDGNGRVLIFMTSALNEMAMRTGGGITVGFTFGLDLLPRQGPTDALSCAASNEAEIFYMIAPDPQGAVGPTVSAEAVLHSSTGIIAHELQHMINTGRRLYVTPNAQELEDLWLNEALSHMAEELVFYRATGLNPARNISWNTIISNRSIAEAYSRFARDNLSFYAEYLSDPDGESPLGKSLNDDDFTTRGAGWAFLRYLADQGEQEDAALFQALVNSPVAGVENLRQALGSDPLQYLQWWAVANLADRLQSDRVEARFTQPSWDYASIFDNEIGGTPLATRTLHPDASLTLTLRGGSASYIRLRAAPGRHARLDTRTGSAPLGELRASVIRVE